jgi:hypothetical protein
VLGICIHDGIDAGLAGSEDGDRAAVWARAEVGVYKWESKETA